MCYIAKEWQGRRSWWEVRVALADTSKFDHRKYENGEKHRRSRYVSHQAQRVKIFDTRYKEDQTLVKVLRDAREK